MKKGFLLFFLIVPFWILHTAQAENVVFTDTFNSYVLGDLNGQGAWLVTKYYPDKLGAIEISTTNSEVGEKYIEVTNDDSIVATLVSTPAHAGILQFKMRHNKSGLFYLFAQTSDAGGQLLFSIQFTPSNGILLEKAGMQTTLLSEYNPNQWYFFTIDFDNKRGEQGAFKIQIDGREYGEHAYVDSESTTFDLAQITLGSVSDGQTSISGFGNGTFISQATTTASTTVTAGLRQLSIALVLATSSITANLDDGYIVTATFDGIKDGAQQGSTSPSTVTEPRQSVSEAIGAFIVDVVSSVITIFTSSNDPEQASETPVDAVIEVPQTESPTIHDIEIENEIQSSISLDVINDEVVTITF